MNVAILVKEFPPDVVGGTETQTLRMATELQERSPHDVTVYTKAYDGPEPHDDVPFDLVRVPNWGITPFVSTLTFVLFAFLYLLRDHRQFDVLQSMMIYPTGFVGYLVNTLTGLPYFAWIRGGDYYFMKENRVKRWTIQTVLRDTLVLVQTERIAADVRSEFPQATLRVLGNGVELPPERADGDAVVYVGRLKRQKGVHVLIEALAETDERLLVVGDGPQRERLESLAVSRDVDAEFVGWVDRDQVGTHLRQGKLFVLPSVEGEGLPNAILEAYAHGLPAVATDTGGVADAVVDGKTGYLVDPGDPDLLRDRIERVATDASARAKMSETARRYVEEHYSWPRIIEELDDLYHERSN